MGQDASATTGRTAKLGFSAGVTEAVSIPVDGTACAPYPRMANFRRQHLLLLCTLMAALVPASTGCYVEAAPPVYAEGYEPQYYDGHVVYYDGVGRPYYYAEGAVVWVAPSSPFYFGLVHHWRIHGPAYRHWYAHGGYRYRGYRHYR